MSHSLTQGADLRALSSAWLPMAVSPWVPGGSGWSLPAALGRGSVLALMMTPAPGEEPWFDLGKVAMANPSFNEMISMQGGGTSAPGASGLSLVVAAESSEVTKGVGGTGECC